MSVGAWREALLALLPPSSAINRAADGVLARVLEACGAAMRGVEQRALSLVAQFDPLQADELLEDWERLFPDECGCLNEQVSKDQRRLRVNTRRLMLGDARPEYFRQMAVTLGYPDARIQEFVPFRATSRCTAAINQGGWRYAWRVNTGAATEAVSATATTACTAPLRVWGDPGLLCLLSRYRPAHTIALVGYEDSSGLLSIGTLCDE
ncbi:YmfQ family protein [Bordetella ansorpii]|nr:putative phage tail protein [Bordetella ansorpii]